MTSEQGGLSRYNSERPKTPTPVRSRIIRPVIEYLVPQLCDVPSVQVRTDRFDDVWSGRVRDSDNPQEVQAILTEVDHLLVLGHPDVE